MPNQRGLSMAEAIAAEAAGLPSEPVSFPGRTQGAPAPAAVAVAAAPRAERSASTARRARNSRTTGVTDSQVPKWQRLERKELRLRADQLDELARLRRPLNRQRGGEGERITENTLIRVAVDLLLSRSRDLVGTTEEELRRSLGLPDLRSPEVRRAVGLRALPGSVLR